MNAGGRRTAGQALPLMALIIPLLTVFLIGVLEFGGFYLSEVQYRDALQHAVRAGIQQLNYEQLAQGQATLRSGGCVAVRQAEAPAECAAFIAAAAAVLQRNLVQQRLTAGAAPAATAAVRWTVLPYGGACAAGGPTLQPTVCAELRTTVRGPFGLRQRELVVRVGEVLTYGLSVDGGQ